VETTLTPLLVNVRNTGLTPDEEVALGLAWFFTFNGPQARPWLEKHQDRADRLGRVSRQALLQMAFAGAKDYDRVTAGIIAFRAKFSPVAADLEYTSRMVDNMARHYESLGDDARAVALILEDVAALPIDVPYGAFRLLATHMPAFQRTGQGPAAIALMTKHRDALRIRLAAAGTSPVGEATPPLLPPHRDGILHLDPFGDGLLEDLPGSTPTTLLLERTIQQVRFFERGR
jgi:hypothetical protein